MDLDGSGLTALGGAPLREPYPEFAADGLVSESGWIAVRTSERSYPDPPADFSLEIYRLPRVEPIRRVPLFSDELIARMEVVSEYPVPDANYTVTGPAWANELVYLTTLSEDNYPRWSPDGRHLAFVAATDGPSSDLYLYDTQTDTIRRLSSGPNQASILGWSPDSRWILHAEASSYLIADGGDIGGFPADVVWAAAADGSGLKRIYQPGTLEWVEGWLSNNVFVVSYWSGYIFLHDLRTVDLDTGTARTRYPGRFYNSALAPEWGLAVLDVASEFTGENDPPPGGLYLVPLDGRPPSQLHPGVVEVNARWLEWFPQLDRFFAGGFRDGYLFSPAGEIGPSFLEERGRASVSPDGSWVAFDEERERPGLRLYRPDATWVREISTGDVFNFVWMPDSSRLFYLEGFRGPSRLRVVSVPDGEPTLVHPDPGFDWFKLVQGE
jgi:hypothetical protein